MSILLVLAHPNSSSFNHAIAVVVKETLEANGYHVIFHDLYSENFSPIITQSEISNTAPLDTAIASYCSELTVVKGIIIVHPNWWGQPPAILKGWIDRVFRSAVAYQFLEGDPGAGVPEGLLHAEKAVVINTSDTPYERELAIFGDPLETLWKNCIFDYCGIRNFYRKTFGVVVSSDSKQRRAWLDEVRNIINSQFPGRRDKNDSKM